jgi:hypothetical protein
MISNEILDMQENQIIAQLKVKWWNEQRVSGEVCTAKKKSKTASLSIKNVGGVFVVLAGGVIGGFLIAICEFIYKARRNAKEDKVSHGIPLLFWLCVNDIFPLLFWLCVNDVISLLFWLCENDVIPLLFWLCENDVIPLLFWLCESDVIFVILAM